MYTATEGLYMRPSFDFSINVSWINQKLQHKRKRLLRRSESIGYKV